MGILINETSIQEFYRGVVCMDGWNKTDTYQDRRQISTSIDARHNKLHVLKTSDHIDCDVLDYIM